MRKISVGMKLHAAVALGLFSVLAVAQTASAQNAPIQNPLSFGNNYFVTGDFVMAGAQGMDKRLVNGFATGTITIPDANPGITGTNRVPDGAQIVAALLYWQTVEKISGLGSGQNGFFRPVFQGGPATGYPITGLNLMSQTTVSFSAGGCSGSSTGKVLRTYRADVRRLLPQDANGNVVINNDNTDPAFKNLTFEVRLPSVGPNAPLTLGATLVLIFRVINSPNFPLSVITIYDGDFAPTNTSLTMMQTMQGFYDAADNPVYRLGQIVGGGGSNKFQKASLDNMPLPSLYGSDQPTFPGFYGTTWDSVVWTFPNPNYPNPVRGGDASVTAQVVPSTSQQGCVTWGAVIFSTTVRHSDNDGILDSWKANHGYCDASFNEAGNFATKDSCTAAGSSWVDLTGAAKGHKDVFVHIDYMCSLVNNDGSCDPANSFYPTQGALKMVQDAFLRHGINLHFITGSAIQEQTCTDTAMELCPYPGQPGIIAWKGGFDSLINQPLNYPDELSCETQTPPGGMPGTGPICMRRVQHGANISQREAIFARALAVPELSFQGGSLTSVVASGNIVTFTTLTPHGLVANDHVHGAGRVTVSHAITNRNLNGTYFVQSVGVNNTNPPTYFFTIQIPTATIATYTPFTDPQFQVGSGIVHTGSGIGDVGGAHLIHSLGLWTIPADQIDRVQGGTLMHEMGHLFGREHGPWEYATQGSYVPTIAPNCDANFPSVMSYLYQVDGLDTGVPGAPTVLDYSGQVLSTINESNLLTYNVTTTNGSRLTYLITKWYTPNPPFGIGSKATHHCDGTSLSPLTDPNPVTFRVEGTTSLLAALGMLGTPVDLNFNGKLDNTSLPGANEWMELDLLQTGAAVGDTLGGGGSFGDGPGAFGDGPGAFGDGPGAFGDGPGAFGDGPGAFGDGPGAASGAELDLETANSVTRRPRFPTATEDASPRVIHLSWTAPTFGQIGAYRIYRSADGGKTFALVPNGQNGAVPGNQLFYNDTVTCNPTGYQYLVSAVLAGTFAMFPPQPNEGQASVASDIVTKGQNGEPLTGCYTFTGFSSPAAGSSAVPGTVVPITWSVQDFSNKSGAFVNNTGANTLVAIGPINNDAVCVSPTVNTPRTTIAQSGAGISVSAGPNFVFSFNWNTTGFAAGCYLLELDLDSGQPKFGGQPASAFQVLIYLSDVSLVVTTPSPLPAATETDAYNTILSESGGTVGGPVPFTWTVVAGALPNGMALGVALDGVSGALTGAPTTPGNYNFTVKVTDSIGDFGTKAFTLLVNALVSTTADSGAGSLRQAIQDVNAAQPGPQPIGILFNIPGNGVQTISPIMPLPALTQPTILDARTQPGYLGKPLIELNGTNAGNPANGLDIAGGSSTVAGLVINRFSGNGIQIDTKGGDVIQANYIGTDKTGATAAPNTGNGIQIIATPNNVVGGANVISGNGGEGVRIDGTLATNNAVVSNRIGTDPTGSFAIGNSASGVYIRRAPGNSVAGNVVSGNLGFAGITICGDQLPAPGFCGGGDVLGIDETSNAAGNAVQGNFIGTDASGVNPLGNKQAGVSIDGAPNNQVGRTGASTANIISNSGTNDVQIFDTGANGNQVQGNTIHGSATAAGNVGINVLTAALTGNTFSQNSISGHAGLGIDLFPAGVDPNPAGGANNFPVLTSAQVGSGTVGGTLSGPANATFTLEFFSNAACNASGHGEGAVFLGSRTVPTDGTGNVVFVAPVAGLVAGKTITATSTDASGTTSEFSTCVTAN